MLPFRRLLALRPSALPLARLLSSHRAGDAKAPLPPPVSGDEAPAVITPSHDPVATMLRVERELGEVHSLCLCYFDV